jgi:hypothetical protein
MLRPEQRLILAALLLAVAEQDEMFIRIKSRVASRTNRVKLRLSESAREFVQSEEFDKMAAEVNIGADKLRVSPEKAYNAFQKLISDSPESENELL